VWARVCVVCGRQRCPRVPARDGEGNRGGVGGAVRKVWWCVTKVKEAV